MSDAMVEHFELFERFLRYTYTFYLGQGWDLYPVLMTEPPWIPDRKREELAELMFEKFDVPGYLPVKTPLLVSLAQGRTTGLVFDSGATQTHAVAVRDGRVDLSSTYRTGGWISAVRKGRAGGPQQYVQDGQVDLSSTYRTGGWTSAVRTGRAGGPQQYVQDGQVDLSTLVRSAISGNFLHLQCRRYLTNRLHVPINPPYMIASKRAVRTGSKAQWVMKKDLPPVHPSWHAYMVKVGSERAVRAGSKAQWVMKKHLPPVHPSWHAYMVKVGSERAVRAGSKAQSVMKKDLPPVRPSWYTYGRNLGQEVIREFQSAVLECCEDQFVEHLVASHPQVPFEFPDGFNENFGADRYRIAESLFDPSLASDLIQTDALGMRELIQGAIRKYDIRAKGLMVSNLMVTGGNTLIKGLTQRLQREVTANVPVTMKCRVFCSGGGNERRFSAWLGGSILASSAAFSSMKFNKSDYEEHGKEAISLYFP
ncbi:unnamed protein product [Cyprideis torosa]|uniref:Uncharacterized protein n=1 Tax=Cyprideis torosa TaxID=163714 RepID=A0A7R8WD52_9CRUS|nr:unnamed protein product [Cyprideis torosa]CAG0894281.1 unnamed protein product [Cyprideis torosa]